MSAAVLQDLLGMFANIWLVDFEFVAEPGERPRVVCLVAYELRSGRELRMWADELEGLRTPPYDTGPRTVFVAYYAAAELSCHLALRWPLPRNILDLFVEFKILTNGKSTPCGHGLLGALAYYDLPGIATAEKDAMRGLILRDEPWSHEEQHAILEYCASDVYALARLLPAMALSLDIERAIVRGAYMRAVASMEHLGVPIDVPTLGCLRANWDGIKARLVARIDTEFGVYDGTTFKRAAFERYLTADGIPWPRLPSGQLSLDDDTFREMARSVPRIAPLYELRSTLAQLRLAELAVGGDNRGRASLRAFQAGTGRNAPSSSKYIFGPSVWIRSLIRPGHETAVAYIDWSQQEFGIAAALSGDTAMLASYGSGDPYLAFGKLAGLIPPRGTKASHGHIRDLCKACVLAVQYGMGAEALAQRIGQTPAHARALLDLHRQAYPVFWRWSDAAVDHAALAGHLYTTFGWRISTGPDLNPRSMRNFPVQANGAEMMRLAAGFAIDRGVGLCAPVHDAFLIEAPIADIDDRVTDMQNAMADASALVLGGLRLRSDAKVIRHPDRYTDPRGERMWTVVMDILSELRGRDSNARPRTEAVACAPTCSVSSTSQEEV